MKYKSDQEGFWAEDYSKEYIKKNSQFDDIKGAEGWSKILQCTNFEISKFLELGCRDFGKLFLENFPVKLIDYGFLWGHIYDHAGFDDITWWVFKKQ